MKHCLETKHSRTQYNSAQGRMDSEDRKIYFVIQVVRLLVRLVPRLWQEGLYR